MRWTRTVVGMLVAMVALGAAGAGGSQDPPTTGFEDTGGASWTSYADEVEFLTEVADRSPRASLSVIGGTALERDMHLVAIGEPAPRTPEDLAAHDEPVVLFVCGVHGNEPAGREACLQWLRDLAFTTDPSLVRQLREQTVLFISNANPDGRERGSRGNSRGTDINRDHLNLRTEEAQAIASVVRDWQPDVSVDLHEYGPSLPALYDDDLLYLWPRNKNVDPMVRWAAKTLSEDYIAPGVEEEGYRAGEYGVYAFGDDVTGHDYHFTQSAGDGDEGIARNGWALKHTASILLESAVTEDPRHGTGELSTAGLQSRRVDTHHVAVSHTLRFMRELGPAAMSINREAAARAVQQGAERTAPVYFNGQDQDHTVDGVLLGSRAESSSVADPPPCGYALTPEQVGSVAETAHLHGTHLEVRPDGSGFVSMAQPTRPLVALLLDARGSRHQVPGTPLQDC